MSLPGHRPTGSHPPPCCRPTPPEGFVTRLTRLVRDEAQQLLFRKLLAGRPRTPSVVPSVSPSSRSAPSFVFHLCKGSTKAPAPDSPSFRPRSRQRIGSLHHARPHLSRGPPKELTACDQQARRVDVCSSRIRFSKTSTHVSFGYRFVVWPKPDLPRWTLRTHGRRTRFGGPNRMVASVLVLHAIRLRPSL